MRIYELFESDTTQDLRNAALDFLTPLLAQHVPFVTVDAVIDALQRQNFNLVIDRTLVQTLLDPDIVEAVAEIDSHGRIKLQYPGEDEHTEMAADDAKKAQNHVADMAVDQVKKELTGPKPPKQPSAPPAAPTPSLQ